jgi:hypothetical protein
MEINKIHYEVVLDCSENKLSKQFAILYRDYENIANQG